MQQQSSAHGEVAKKEMMSNKVQKGKGKKKGVPPKGAKKGKRVVAPENQKLDPKQRARLNMANKRKGGKR